MHESRLNYRNHRDHRNPVGNVDYAGRALSFHRVLHTYRCPANLVPAGRGGNVGRCHRDARVLCVLALFACTATSTLRGPYLLTLPSLAFLSSAHLSCYLSLRYVVLY